MLVAAPAAQRQLTLFRLTLLLLSAILSPPRPAVRQPAMGVAPQPAGWVGDGVNEPGVGVGVLVAVGVGVAVLVGVPVTVGVRVIVGVVLGVCVGPSLQGTDTATFRQPRIGSHESVVHCRPSSQFSKVQNLEQPSQLFGSVPAGATSLSQSSGNSTMPLPHVGHGMRQFCSANAVHVAYPANTGSGVTPPAIKMGCLRSGYPR